jgi:hypothetical protein
MIYGMMARDMRTMQPSEPLFWGVMSLGVVIGFLTAYPVNVWMVSKNLKHGLMTRGAAMEHHLAQASLPAPHLRRTEIAFNHSGSNSACPIARLTSRRRPARNASSRSAVCSTGPRRIHG